MEKLEEIAAAMEKTAKKKPESGSYRGYQGCRKRAGGRSLYYDNNNGIGEITDGVEVGEILQNRAMRSL